MDDKKKKGDERPSSGSRNKDADDRSQQERPADSRADNRIYQEQHGSPAGRKREEDSRTGESMGGKTGRPGKTDT